MAQVTLNEWLSQNSLLSSGLSYAARFSVEITNPRSAPNLGINRVAPLLCEAAELPARAFDVQTYRYYGPSFVLPVNSNYNTIDFTFLVQDSMSVKKIFDSWLDLINPKSSYDFDYRENYESQVTITQYSYFDKPDSYGQRQTYKAILREAYPINVSALGTNWGEDNIHRLQVSMAFTDWLSQDEKNSIT